MRIRFLPALLLAACALPATRSPAPANDPALLPAPGADAIPTGFPARCTRDEVQVMLLGTYDFDGDGTDPVQQSPDDPLSTRRQEELQELAARLGEWQPQQVVVDWPFATNDSTLARYRRFGAGTLQASRHEMVQVGFRIARRMGLAEVSGFGQPWVSRSDSTDALLRRRPEMRHAVDEAIRLRKEAEDSVREWRRGTTLIEHFRALNSDAALHAGHSAALFGGFLGIYDGENAGGAEVVADWYARNARMAQNLARLVRPGTVRLLVLVDADHVPALRSILDESPRFCPVSPLPFLR